MSRLTRRDSRLCAALRALAPGCGSKTYLAKDFGQPGEVRGRGVADRRLRRSTSAART